MTKSSTLIVSYCWTQDAERLGALIDKDGKALPSLIDRVVIDLAEVHGVTRESIEGLFDRDKDVHAWDWYHYPETSGIYF